MNLLGGSWYQAWYCLIQMIAMFWRLQLQAMQNA
jgi:hypothetical protein